MDYDYLAQHDQLLVRQPRKMFFARAISFNMELLLKSGRDAPSHGNESSETDCA